MEEKMKKKIALFLIAALLCAGLIIGCGDEKEKEQEVIPPPVTYKVTFDPDGRPFEDGTTAVITVEVEDDAAVGSKWPVVDEENIGTDTLLGWYDGDTQYTRTTKIKKDVALKAKYDAAKFTFDNVARTATHTNFVISVSPGGTHSNFDGEEEGGNKFTFKVGGIQYLFPVTVGFNYEDYDFVDVEFTATNAAGMVLKNYGSAVDYDAYNGSIVDGEKKVVTFELRNATAAGFAIQKWNGNVPDITIEITKITFIQRTRYKIKFDTDGGTPALPDSYLVDATKVGNHLPTDVTKTNYIFAGWLNGTTPVNASTVVDKTFDNATLKPLWLANVTVTPINVTFSAVSDLTAHGTATVALVTDGFSQTGANYDGVYVSFPVTIPAGATLAHYDKVTLTIEGKAGDFGWKPVWLMASSRPMPNNPSAGGTVVRGMQVSNEIQYTTGKLDLELTIVKPLAANLTGTIDVSIMFRAGNTGGSPSATTVVEFTKIKLQ